MNYKTRQPFPHAAYVEGQRNFTYFDRSLTSGLTDVVIESPGDFLYIDQVSTGVVSVELNMRQGGTLAPILLAAGGSIECDFASIKLTASAQLNKTVRLVVGNGARIKGGANINASSMSVTVVDGGKVRTQANQAFCGYAYSAATAGQYSHAQLANPAGSGKNVFVTKTSITASNVAASFSLSVGTQEGATLFGSALSKYVGGAASAAKLRAHTNAVNIAGAQYFLTVPSAIGGLFTATFDEPLLLTPGQNITWGNQSANSGAYANFEFFEE